MERTPTPEEHAIHLPHASADDGDWAEVAPETVHALTSYLWQTGYYISGGRL